MKDYRINPLIGLQLYNNYVNIMLYDGIYIKVGNILILLISNQWDSNRFFGNKILKHL